MSHGDLDDAISLVNQLYEDAWKMHDKDPEQEIGEREYGLIDTILNLGDPYVGNHPAAREVRDLFSPDAVAAGQPIRVADVLITIGALKDLLSRAKLDEDGAVRRRRGPHHPSSSSR